MTKPTEASTSKASAKAKTVKYDLAEQLRTPEEMAAYLKTWLEAPDDSAGIAHALGDTVRARGMTKVARDAGLNRESGSEGEILTSLARGEQEIAAGMGHDLDEVLAEADQLLPGWPELEYESCPYHDGEGFGGSSPMCRNIKILFNFDPPVTDEEVRAASLQFVRKVTGFNKPSKANEVAFYAAVDEIARISTNLLSGLETNSPPRNREDEAAKAKLRAARRFSA